MIHTLLQDNAAATNVISFWRSPLRDRREGGEPPPD